MLKLLNTSKEFVAYLMNYKDLCIETDLNTADKTLSMTYMTAGVLENEAYIETETDRYVIKELHPAEDGTEVVCQLDLEDLEADPFEKYTASEKTAQEMANYALVGTGWTARVDESLQGRQRNVQVYQARPRQVIEKIRDAFMCEIQYDTIGKVVCFTDRIGDYKGVYFRRGLNLSKLNTTIDSYDYYTRILPIGKDGLRIRSVNDGSDYVSNFQYSTKIKTYVWEDTSYEDAQLLKDDAIMKLADMSKPKVSYEASIWDLARMSERYSVLSYGIGDTVDIVDPLVQVKDQQRIVKIKEYPDEPQKNSCELSNTVLTFEELQDRFQKAADAWDDSTNANGNIKGVRVEGVEVDGVVGIEVYVNDQIEGSEYISGINDQVTINTGNIETNTDDISTNATAISGVAGRVGTLEATALTATTADLRYADIGLANITQAVAHSLYARTGMIKSLIVDEQMVDFLDAVEIEADKITAGTIVADRILLTSSQGLINAMNVLGQTAGNQDTLLGSILEEASVSGTKLVANSVTAMQINVADLFAQDITATGTIRGMSLIGVQVIAEEGTIAGFTLGEHTLTTDGFEIQGNYWVPDSDPGEEGETTYTQYPGYIRTQYDEESDPMSVQPAMRIKTEWSQEGWIKFWEGRAHSIDLYLAILLNRMGLELGSRYNDVEIEIAGIKKDMDAQYRPYGTGFYKNHDGSKYIEISAEDGHIEATGDITAGGAIYENGAALEEKYLGLEEIAATEEDTAAAAHSKGTYLIHDSHLCEVTANIAANDSLVEGTNIEQTTVGEELSSLNSRLDTFLYRTCTVVVSGGTIYANNIRKNGNICSLTFGIEGLNNVAAGLTLFTLPEGFRPQYDFSDYVWGVLSANPSIIQGVMCSFRANGTVTINHSNGTNVREIHICNYMYFAP